MQLGSNKNLHHLITTFIKIIAIGLTNTDYIIQSSRIDSECFDDVLRL